MEDGIYTRREFQIVLYEKKGAESFVIVNNDHYANEPVVLSGKNAENLIQAIATCLDGDKEKGS